MRQTILGLMAAALTGAFIYMVGVIRRNRLACPLCGRRVKWDDINCPHCGEDMKLRHRAGPPPKKVRMTRGGPF
jgi:hypothetical protein